MATYNVHDGDVLNDENLKEFTVTFEEDGVTKTCSVPISVEPLVPYLVYGANNIRVDIDDIGKLCTTGNATSSVTVGGVNIVKNSIKEIHLRNRFEELPNNFAYLFVGLEKLTGTSSVKTIGDNFCTGSNGDPFDCDLDLSNCTSIGNCFLQARKSFNSNITFSNNIAKIGTYFMNGCSVFNKPILLPQTMTDSTIINNYFMNMCVAFEGPLRLPNNVTEIGTQFLNGCQNFNSPLVLPNTITKIGATFMQSVYAFNQPFTFPSSLTSVGQSFFCAPRDLVSTVTINCPATVFATTGTNLATTSNTAPCYVQGIPIAGTYATQFKTRFANTTRSPYRKLL